MQKRGTFFTITTLLFLLYTTALPYQEISTPRTLMPYSPQTPFVLGRPSYTPPQDVAPRDRSHDMRCRDMIQDQRAKMQQQHEDRNHIMNRLGAIACGALQEKNVQSQVNARYQIIDRNPPRRDEKDQNPPITKQLQSSQPEAYNAPEQLSPEQKQKIEDKKRIQKIGESLNEEVAHFTHSSTQLTANPHAHASQKINHQLTTLAQHIDTIFTPIETPENYWWQALHRRRNAIAQTLYAPTYQHKKYSIPDDYDLYFDDDTLELLTESQGSQIINEIHEEFLLICNHLYGYDDARTYEGTNDIINTCIRHGATALCEDNVLLASHCADLCWTLHDDYFLDHRLTEASERLFSQALTGGDSRKLFPVAMVCGFVERMRTLGQHACLFIEDPQKYLENKINSLFQVSQALGVLLNAHYEPLSDDYDYSWTNDDIQERIAMNEASSHASAQAWILLGTHLKEKWKNADQQSIGKWAGSAIADNLTLSCLSGSLRMLKNLKPTTLAEIFVAPLEHSSIPGSLCELHLYRLRQINFLQSKTITKGLLDSVMIPCGEKTCTTVLEELIMKNPALLHLPATEEAARKLFSLVTQQLHHSQAYWKDLALYELADFAKNTATASAEKKVYESIQQSIIPSHGAGIKAIPMLLKSASNIKAATPPPSRIIPAQKYQVVKPPACTAYLPASPAQPWWEYAKPITYSLTSAPLSKEAIESILDDLVQQPKVTGPQSGIFTQPPLEICRDVFEKESKKINALFDQKKYCLKNVPELEGIPLTLDTFHLIYPKPFCKHPRRAIGMSGFHYDYNFALLNQGAYNLRNVKKLQNGVYEGKVYMFGAFLREKTFFPPYWDAETLCNKIIEALESNTQSPTTNSSYRSGPMFLFKDLKTSEGILISISISSKGKIISAYPQKIN